MCCVLLCELEHCDSLAMACCVSGKFRTPLEIYAASLPDDVDITGHGNIGALIITHTIVVVPYCDYSILGPKTLF